MAACKDCMHWNGHKLQTSRFNNRSLAYIGDCTLTARNDDNTVKDGAFAFVAVGAPPLQTHEFFFCKTFQEK